MRCIITLLPTTLMLMLGIRECTSFQSFQMPSFSFGANKTPTRTQDEATLLDKISNTNNGKTATINQQKEILQLVSALEQTFPSPPLKEVVEDGKIDGTWFLQFTSPSEIEGNEDLTDSWEVENPEENITTKKFDAKGTVTAGGIKVDVSKIPPKQIFDLSQSTVTNEVSLDFGLVCVGGKFRLSENNDKRAVVAFNKCLIKLNLGLEFDLGFLFAIRALIVGSDEAGWLETTYLSDRVRIGRGNKGSMFILTRDESDVNP